MSEDALDRAVARTRSQRIGRRAKRARACFRGHATWFVIVNVALLAGWATDRIFTGEESVWFLPVLVGWGIGLLAHWLVVRPAFRDRHGDQPNGG